ncbi:MAG: hypothetical protein GY722_13420, partial [bacterium]|nr:hypothetical protein [bacterium]
MTKQIVPPFLRLSIPLLALFVLASACGSSEENDTSQDAGDESASADESASVDVAYSIVDTDQTWCFSDAEAIQCGDDFVGQDAQYEGLQPAYQDNGDGTVTDLNTGLMWIQDAGD